MKTKFTHAEALEVGNQILETLRPACMKMVIAGSIRRLKPLVGDVEIVYVPQVHTEVDPDNMFSTIEVPDTDGIIRKLQSESILVCRKNQNGIIAFGPKNKLMAHVPSGIPISLFATTADAWWNYLVCRTGPAESNAHIAIQALRKGWRWNPYGAGFTRFSTGEVRQMHSEQEVFEFVGLRYLPPQKRT